MLDAHSRVLVTGAAGLLGVELCLALRARGTSVLGVDNLSRYALLGETGPRNQRLNVDELLRAGVDFEQTDFKKVSVNGKFKIDAVVHAAAQVCHSRKGDHDDPFDDLQTNVVGTVQLLDDAVSSGIPFLFIGSSKVYGENFDRYARAGGIDESCPLGDQTHLTFFGASKAAADLFCQMYARKNEKVPVGIFRPGCFTGKRALATEAQNWVPWLIHCAKTGKTFNVFGDGEQVRDMLHVSDLTNACVRWLDAPRSDVWNLGGSKDSIESINTAITRVERLTGRQVLRSHQAPRAGDIRRLVLNSSKFAGGYNWNQSVPLAAIYDELA